MANFGGIISLDKEVFNSIVEALEFYAADENRENFKIGGVRTDEISLDRGKIAKAALKTLEKTLFANKG